MKAFSCDHCGASKWYEKNGHRYCSYCGSQLMITSGKSGSVHDSSIDISDDVKRLLQKCKADPARAARYANLILDIDPDNKDALRYL